MNYVVSYKWFFMKSIFENPYKLYKMENVVTYYDH